MINFLIPKVPLTLVNNNCMSAIFYPAEVPAECLLSKPDQPLVALKIEYIFVCQLIVLFKNAWCFGSSYEINPRI